MKLFKFTILTTSIFTILLLVNANAATLMWDASSGEVEGYKVYYGTNPTSHPNSVNVGNTTNYSLDNLPLSEKTQYYICVTAYNAAGESPPCAPVAFTPQDNTPPTPPTGLNAK